jgi:hypothetical protein
MAALEEILQRHPVWRGGAPACAVPAAVPPISSGFAGLDRELPGGGWPAGGLSEILCGHAGIGELQLVLPALARLSWAGRRVAWLAPPYLPYAPALAAAGLDLAHLVVLRAPGRRDALWAAEQVLRSGSCAALLAWMPQARYEELRRLSVAAEAGRTWAAAFRPLQAAQAASPASLRLSLEPAGDALAVHILKRRGAPAAAPLHLPLKRPVHALARTALSAPAAGHARGDRRLGVPVHA